MAKNNRPLVLKSRLTVMTSETDFEYVKQLAEKSNISMGDFIRQLIEEYKERDESLKQQELGFH